MNAFQDSRPANSGDKPAFDVASIKPSKPGTQFTVGIELRHGRLTGSNVSLRSILAAAYDVQEAQIIGPSWLDEDRFELAAKSPAGVPDSQMGAMLRLLLKDRFQFAGHQEIRSASGYDLVVAKGGPRMAIYPEKEREMPFLPGVPQLGGSLTMPLLAKMLSNVLSRPVVDKTGLTKRYNFLLVYAPLSPQPGGPEINQPDLFTAVQNQLGLKLQLAKENVNMVVVDHIERTPSEN